MRSILGWIGISFLHVIDSNYEPIPIILGGLLCLCLYQDIYDILLKRKKLKEE